MGYQIVCFKWDLQTFSIFQNCLKFGYFPAAWKRANVVPVYKKGSK